VKESLTLEPREGRHGNRCFILDKGKAFGEAIRVLKSKGRLMIADQILTEKLPEDPRKRMESCNDSR